MNKFLKVIPVLFLVLVFIFVQIGCSGENVMELEELQQDSSVSEAEQETVSPESTEFLPEEIPVGVPVPETTDCVVHICGAVQNPGVYTLEEGSRICDAVRMAGGLTDDASDRSINQAAQVTDGMQIVIPTVEEASLQSSGMQNSGEGAEDGPQLVDLNTATKAELMTLPGIGETRAEAILMYREKNGRFSTIEEIMQVNGIKEGSFQKLREYITVR